LGNNAKMLYMSNLNMIKYLRKMAYVLFMFSIYVFYNIFLAIEKYHIMLTSA